MTIPNFKSVEDWEDYEEIFKNRWDAKKALLERVRDDLFPECSWKHLHPKAVEVINDIVQTMLYIRKMKMTFLCHGHLLGK
jgi:hypothetical protein